MSQPKKQFLKTIKNAVPVLLICLALNGAMLGLLWTHYTGGLGQAGEALVMLENKLLDMRFVLRGKQKPSAKIGILALDERSIQKFGRWPFSRSVYEQAFVNLKKAGAEWIGLDLVWDQPQRPLLAEALPEIRQMASNPKKSTETLRMIEELDNVGLADRAVVSAVKEYNKVVLGYMFYEPLERENVKALSGREFAALGAMQDSVINAAILPDGFELNKYPDLAIGALVGNTDFIATSSPNFGFFNNEPESDAVMRWVTMLRSAKESLLPSMSLKMAAKITGRDIVAVFDRIGVEEIMLVNPDDDKDVIKIPVDPTGRGKVMLNHLGPSATLKRISLAEAYDGVFSDTDAKAIRGMSFVMGPTAMAINDIRANPFDSTFNGVEHHATMIDNIVSKRFFRRPVDIYRQEMLVLAVLGLVFSIVLSFTSALASAVSLVLVSIGYFYLDRYLWFSNGIWVYMGMPYIQITGLYVTVTLYKYFTEEREKRKVKGAFQHYLSPDVMNQVLDNPDKLKLGGERRECTVFFSDVRGFTTISEALSPEKLVELMNEYLSPMTDVILKSGGVLDKYIGDAIMAFWGAPIESPNQADIAANAVLGMLEKLEELRRVFPTKGFPVIDIGCGLNTGMVSVGNMGSAERFAYTVMGDVVNLAARLESITKQYGVRCVLSQNSYGRFKNPSDYLIRDLDDIVVKGKREAVKIYELVAPHTMPNINALKNLIGEFQLVREFYRKQDWSNAKKHLSACIQLRPDDVPTRIYFDRVQEMEKMPFIENWDGVHVFKHK